MEPLDWTSLRENCAGDESLVNEVLELFRREVDGLMRDVRVAVEAHAARLAEPAKRPRAAARKVTTPAVPAKARQAAPKAAKPAAPKTVKTTAKATAKNATQNATKNATKSAAKTTAQKAAATPSGKAPPAAAEATPAAPAPAPEIVLPAPVPAAVPRGRRGSAPRVAH